MTLRRTLIFLFLGVLGLVGHSQWAIGAEKEATVVILHGIARDSKSMSSVETALKESGYKTLAITYPSTKKDIKAIADHLHETALSEVFWQEVKEVHFVTHSMGGLVARAYLDKYRNEKLGRVVMLAPPNQGSEVADLIHKIPMYKWYYGPAGNELTTGAQKKNESRPYYELGIIAGTKEWPYVVAAIVAPGKSDGRVSVERTKLEGMKDHVELSATHTFIMDKPDVHRQVINFLEHGEFNHDE